MTQLAELLLYNPQITFLIFILFLNFARKFYFILKFSF